MRHPGFGTWQQETGKQNVNLLAPPAGFREDAEAKAAESYEYDLIGVTVHTGTADGGHYYSFIRDIVNPHAYKNNKW